MKRAVVFTWPAALVFLVSLVRAASAQDAVAVITELKFNRGDIQLRATHGAAAMKPAVYTSWGGGVALAKRQNWRRHRNSTGAVVWPPIATKK